MTDLYETLGIHKGATKSQIKAAWRKLAKSHHPDKGGDPETFKQVKEAYEVLSDDDRRKLYDETGSIHSAVNNKEAEMYGVLVQLVTQVIDQVSDVDNLDLISAVKKVLKDGISQGERQIRNNDRSIAKRRSVIEKLTCSDGPNILTEALQGQIEQFEKSTKDIQEQLGNNQTMIGMIEKYQYSFTSGSHWSSSYYQSSTTTFSLT